MEPKTAIPPRLMWLGGALVIAAVTLVAYIPAMRADFIWDDDWLLTQNPRMGTWAGLGKLWASFEQPDYLPLTWSSLWAQWQVGELLGGGEDTAPQAHPSVAAANHPEAWPIYPDTAWPYHLVNVLLHIVGALLVWQVLRRLDVPGAWLAALVFAVHPVNVASVAWVVERKNVLSMVFFLLTILAYLRHERTGRWGWYVGSIVLFAAALLSKSSVVAIPLVLLGLVWYTRGRVGWPDVLKVAPLLAMSFAAAYLAVRTQNDTVIQTESVFGPNETIFWRLAGAGWSVWFYIAKDFWPAKMAMIYPRWNPDPLNMLHWAPLVAVVAGLAALWWYRDRRYVRPAALAMGYFVLMLLPVLGFFRMFFMRFSMAADHWQHLSIIGLIALVVGVLWWAAGRLGRRAQRTGAIVAAVVVAAMGVQTWRQASTYKNQETLWRDNLAKYPDTWMASFSLGNVMSHYYDISGKNEDLQQAYRWFRHSVEHRPDFHMARNNLGNLLVKEHRFAEALATYTEAMFYKPDDARIHNNRGTMLWELGRPTEALQEVLTALGYQPEYTPARLNTAEFLSRMGQFPAAAEHLREGIKYDPYNADLPAKLGITLLQLNRTDEAIEYLRKSLAIDPRNVGAMQNLGVALTTKGRFAEAIMQYDRALEVSRQNPDKPAGEETSLLLNKGFVYQKMGQPALAALAYEEALAGNPNSPEILKSLSWLRSTYPEASVRNGRKALELAAKLNEVTGGTMSDVMDCLGAAWAELGDFDQARRWAQKGSAAARAGGMTQFADEIAARERLYATGQPFRHDPTVATNP